MKGKAPIWIEVAEAERRFFELIDQVIAGGEFVITCGGQLVATLCAYPFGLTGEPGHNPEPTR